MNHIKISWGQSGEPMKTPGPLAEFLNENLLTCSPSGFPPMSLENSEMNQRDRKRLISNGGK